MTELEGTYTGPHKAARGRCLRRIAHLEEISVERVLSDSFRHGRGSSEGEFDAFTVVSLEACLNDAALPAKLRHKHCVDHRGQAEE